MSLLLYQFKFTFQSGDIRIEYVDVAVWFFEKGFTFQSGDIRISYLQFSRKTEKANLHSNLVIFESKSWDILIPTISDLHSNLVIFEFFLALAATNFIIVFTFQSGDIRILCQLNSYAAIRKFTFQSGDIRIYILAIKF